MIILGRFYYNLEFTFFARLDVYIHDYLLKRKLHASAKAFMTEGKVATDPVGMLSWVPFMYLILGFNAKFVFNLLFMHAA